ncbi:MAG: hypothetical protein HOB61_01890 [Actinobacteria bacterium]|nr:hypothetical protein [Actinomycetota bacterium]
MGGTRGYVCQGDGRRPEARFNGGRRRLPADVLVRRRQRRVHCEIFDAADPAPGPIVRVKLPERISSGTHAT